LICGLVIVPFLKITEMNPKLLRNILTWVAPLVIGFIVKKYEQRQERKRNPTLAKK